MDEVLNSLTGSLQDMANQITVSLLEGAAAGFAVALLVFIILRMISRCVVHVSGKAISEICRTIFAFVTVIVFLLLYFK